MNRVVVVLPFTPVTATIGIRPVVAFGEQRRDDRFADRARLAGRRFQVHPQSGRGVHFDHDPAQLIEGPRDVERDDVNAGDVEPDHAGRVDGPGGKIGMNFVGDVGRGAARAQIRVAANQHLGPFGRNGIDGVALIGQHAERHCVERNLAQAGRVVLATAGIVVDHLDQLANRVNAVAEDLRRLAASGRHQLAADDEQTIIRRPSAKRSTTIVSSCSRAAL